MSSEIPLSQGHQFLPSAFEGEILALGTQVSDKQAFRQIYNKYVLSVLSDPAQIVHARLSVVHETRRVIAKSYGEKDVEFIHDMRKVDHKEVLVNWCAVSLATESYFLETAAAYNWEHDDCNDLKRRWFEFLALAFVPSSAPKKLELKNIRDWSADFLSKHARDAGPLESCALCTSKCFYGKDVPVFLDHITRMSFANRMTYSDPIDSFAMGADSFAKSLSSDKNVDLAYCYAAHLVHDQRMTAESEMEFMTKLRETLEKNDDLDLVTADIATRHAHMQCTGLRNVISKGILIEQLLR